MSDFAEILVSNPNDLRSVARHLLSDFPLQRVFAFHGAMGAGKTTLIKALCEQLGATEHVCSPTFTIINEYVGSHKALLYHFDFYRLKSSREAFDTGAADYLNTGCYCFVEWPEVAPLILPDDTLHVTLLPGAHENERRVVVGLEMQIDID